jgi:HTH-type transcriptional regulator / antitoxin HigA
MNAITSQFGYRPDHATRPGKLIEDYLNELDISARELARRCGRSAKLITEIVLGKAPLEPETALQLERVLKLDASIWLNMEANYRLRIAREEEDAELAEQHGWATTFPLKALAERKWLSLPDSKGAQVRELLRFFGTGSIAACQHRFRELLAVDYRTSPAFQNDNAVLCAWLRIGEIQADRIETATFDREAFLSALKAIRPLSRMSVPDALPTLQKMCAEAGVAFVLEKPFTGMAVSGVSRWLSPRRALIQQTLRHKANDHFWFTFYHECAHLLLHSRKVVFIDVKSGKGNAGEKQEAEANEWAADFLVPSRAMKQFLADFEETEEEVVEFAEAVGVSPGIVVGQLQHRGVLPFSRMNRLREHYTWKEDG